MSRGRGLHHKQITLDSRIRQIFLSDNRPTVSNTQTRRTLNALRPYRTNIPDRTRRPNRSGFALRAGRSDRPYWPLSALRTDQTVITLRPTRPHFPGRS